MQDQINKLNFDEQRIYAELICVYRVGQSRFWEEHNHHKVFTQLTETGKPTDY